MSTSDEKIIEALQENCGNVSRSAKALGLTREWLSERIRKSDKLQEVRDDAREEMLDIAEENIFEGLKKEQKNPFNGNFMLSRWVLGTLGKKRGYTERKELTGEGGGAVQITLKRKTVK